MLMRVSSDVNGTQLNRLFEKIVFKTTNSASKTTVMFGGHYVLPQKPAELDPKNIWVKIQSITGDTYFAAAKPGGGNLLTLHEVEPAEDEPTMDEPSLALPEQQRITMEHYGATTQKNEQPKNNQPNFISTGQQPTTSGHYIANSPKIDQPTIEPTAMLEGTSERTYVVQNEGRLYQDRAAGPYTQLSFAKHTSELLKRTPSLAVIKEKSSIIHTYYIATTDQRFNPKYAVEFLNSSSGTVIPLYRCKIKLLLGLYEKIRSTNNKPKKFWKPYPKDSNFQLFTMPLTRKMSDHILTTVFCNL